ncbi:hypothetical protein CFP56_000850 [Quercus suber]|uniref:Uncharacterized protein n=1 Tax=Quercus suber TaxID=58331 RepID=A0AAW0LFT4_QUESU
MLRDWDEMDIKIQARQDQTLLLHHPSEEKTGWPCTLRRTLESLELISIYLPGDYIGLGRLYHALLSLVQFLPSVSRKH